MLAPYENQILKIDSHFQGSGELSIKNNSMINVPEMKTAMPVICVMS